MLNMTTLNYQPWKLHSTRSTWVDFTLLPLNWGSLTCQSSNTNPKQIHTFFEGQIHATSECGGKCGPVFFQAGGAQHHLNKISRITPLEVAPAASVCTVHKHYRPLRRSPCWAQDLQGWKEVVHPESSSGGTLQEINISHLGKRKIIFKYALSGGYVNSLEGNISYIFPGIPVNWWKNIEKTCLMICWISWI